jgi:AcrR family transcriptional regulator
MFYSGMDERAERILTVAMQLAERDGYEAVRLRDLAAAADVALGTVYKRFRSKEDILAAALDLQIGRMQEAIRGAPIPGKTPEERLHRFFETATRALGAAPKLTGAMLRTVASGVPEISEKVMQFYGRTSEIIVTVYRGSHSDAFPSEEEQTVALLLLNVWFAALVGWTGGMHDTDQVIKQVKIATTLLLRGMEKR